MALGPLLLWGWHPQGAQSPSCRLVSTFPTVSPSRIVHQTWCFTPSAESLTHCDAQLHSSQSHCYNWKEHKCRDWQMLSMNVGCLEVTAQLGQGPPRPTFFSAQTRIPRQSGALAPELRHFWRLPDGLLARVPQGGELQTLFRGRRGRWKGRYLVLHPSSCTGTVRPWVFMALHEPHFAQR